MLPMTNDRMAEISSIQWLDANMIKERYADLLRDAMKCERVELLRSLVIYRLQERAYNIRLPDEIRRTLEQAVAGANLKKAPADSIGKVNKKLIREYEGRTYEVLLMADDTVEYEGRKYSSLTAVAEAITGTHWNGRKFFGVKKS